MNKAWVSVLFIILHSLAQPVSAQSTDSTKAAEKNKITIDKWRFAFELPSEKWRLFEKQEKKHPEIHAGYIYKREGIRDAKNRNIEPVIGFVFSKVPKGHDIMLFDISRRRNLFKPVEDFTHKDGPIQLKLAIGYVGTYTQSGVEHTVKAVYAIDGEIGIQVIMDVTSELFAIVEPEFDHTLKTLSFIKE